MIRVCHMTSAHMPGDNRVFRKECRTLAKAGYEVYYVVPGGENGDCDGVHIVGTGEKPQTQSLGQMLKSAIKNRSLISIIVASIVMLLAQLTMQGMANYVYPNYYNSPEAQSASTVVMMVGMVVVSSKQTKKQVEEMKKEAAEEEKAPAKKVSFSDDDADIFTLFNR